MNQPYINTSQNVTINYSLADVGIRILARILDILFIVIYCVVIIILIQYIITISNIYTADVHIILIFILIVPAFTYSLWTHYFMNGQSFGKKILQIKVVKEDGSEASFGTYFIRWLLNIVDSFFSNILGLIVLASTQKRQRVADLVAKTIVISTKQAFSINQNIFSDIQEEYQPKFHNVLQLSDKDIHIIQSLLERAKRTTDHDLLVSLRDKVKSVILEDQPEMTNIIYLETVLKDYQYFSQQQ